MVENRSCFASLVPNMEDIFSKHVQAIQVAASTTRWFAQPPHPNPADHGFCIMVTNLNAWQPNIARCPSDHLFGTRSSSLSIVINHDQESSAIVRHHKSSWTIGQSLRWLSMLRCLEIIIKWVAAIARLQPSLRLLKLETSQGNMNSETLFWLKRYGHGSTSST